MSLRIKSGTGRLVLQRNSPFRIVRCGTITPGDKCGACQRFSFLFLRNNGAGSGDWSLDGNGRAYDGGALVNIFTNVSYLTNCLHLTIVGDRFQETFAIGAGNVTVQNTPASVLPPTGHNWEIVANTSGYLSLTIRDVGCCNDLELCAGLPSTISVTATLSGNIQTTLPDDLTKPNLGAIPSDGSCGFYSGTVRIQQVDGTYFAGTVWVTDNTMFIGDATFNPASFYLQFTVPRAGCAPSGAGETHIMGSHYIQGTPPSWVSAVGIEQEVV